METGKAIYKLLKDSVDVGAICADRIYPELAQQDADAPFIVYTVVDTTPSPTKNSTSKMDTARVELYCLSDDYEQAMDLGIAVRGALDRQSGTIAGVEVQSIDFDTSDIQFDPDQRIYVLEHTYDVRVQRTGTAVSVAQFPGNTFTVEEVDGSPTGAVNKLVVSNGSLSIDGNTATITTGGNVTSVNTQTGDVVLDADDISDATTSNKFATQAQLDKVDNLTVTQAVDLDTLESDTATNNAKVGYTDAAVDARIALADITDLADTPASLGTAGQILAVNTGATALEFVDQSIVDTQYHGRYDTAAETLRAGATGNVEFYYTARPDGDGTAESETSDVGETDTIIRTLAYSTKHRADPDTAADWTDYTTQPADNASFATAKAALLAGLNETDATAETRGTLPVSLKMTRTVTTVVSDLLLDTYPGAAAAYSVRKLDKDYAGNCMRVRRSSDNTTQDIGFTSAGDLDTSALASFVGDADGFVVIWYDQSGNGNNLTQATSSSQPLIYDRTAAAVITDNGKPALSFDGALSGDHMTASGFGTGATRFITHVANVTGGGNGYENVWIFLQDASTSTTGDFLQYYTTTPASGSILNSPVGTRDLAGLSAIDQQRLGTFVSLPSSTEFFLDGTSEDSGTGSITSLEDELSIAAFHPNYALMKFQEMVVWNSDQTSNRSGIESDINTYFSIYA